MMASTLLLLVVAVPGEAFGHAGLEFASFSESVSVEPGYVVDVGDDTTLRFVGFARIDSMDSSRTHFDIRELFVETFVEDWVLGVGIGKTFWGVVESRHLVDIVNQTDFVEQPDGEAKLGQPMIRVGVETESLGMVTAFVMPGFRRRTFAGPDGRFPLPVPLADAPLESTLGRAHPDLAVRWSSSFGDLELALSHFYGHSREPVLAPVPSYPLMHQTGLETQLIAGAWLLKLESIARFGQGAPFAAASGGVEYTWSGAFGTRADLGFIAEGHYDGRDDGTFTFHDHDAFGGLRIALNDEAGTELLAGSLVDVRTGSTVVSVEASRRLGDRIKLSLEALVITTSDAEDPVSLLDAGDYVLGGVDVYL